MDVSRLFNIEPIGVGTPYVESLPSYIKRLAEAHSVFPGVLLTKEIYPEISYNGSMKYSLNNWSKSSLSFNFINETIRILEIKTSNCNIRNLSLLKFGSKIYQKFVFRRDAAWCPICYEESKQFNSTIYEPLIWSIEDVSICKKHNVKLHFLCPTCNRQIQRYESELRIGYCPRCNTWLGSDQADKGNEFSVLAYDQISEILCKLPSFDSSNEWEKLISESEIYRRFQLLKKINELISLQEEFAADRVRTASHIAFAKSRDISM